MFMFKNENFKLKFNLGSIKGDLIEIVQACRPIALKHTQGALKRDKGTSYQKLALKRERVERNQRPHLSVG